MPVAATNLMFPTGPENSPLDAACGPRPQSGKAEIAIFLQTVCAQGHPFGPMGVPAERRKTGEEKSALITEMSQLG